MDRSITLSIVVTIFFITVIVGCLSANATTISAPALPLYNAPSLDSAVISKISKGSMVKIGVCNSSWCYISTKDQKGWVETPKLSSIVAQANRKAASASSGDKTSAKKGRNSVSIDVSITIVAETHASVTQNVKHLDLSKIPAAHLH